MSDKYIIKNCPARSNGFCGDDCPELFCIDKTDCLLKRIIKITKNYDKGCGKHCDINRKANNCGKYCNAYKIKQILQLLDIEECK